jgi:hypothetical protein
MKPNSLTHRILQNLSASPDGLTCRQLLDRIPDVERGGMSGTLGWLAREGGVVRDRTPGKPIVFKLVPEYLARYEAKAEAQALVKAAAAEVRRRQQTSAAKPRAADEAFTCRTSHNNSLKQCNPRYLSDQLADDVRAFEAAGGRIERLPPGACSRPLLDLYE